MLQSHVLPRLTWFAILYLLHQVPCHLNLFCFLQHHLTALLYLLHQMSHNLNLFCDPVVSVQQPHPSSSQSQTAM